MRQLLEPQILEPEPGLLLLLEPQEQQQSVTTTGSNTGPTTTGPTGSASIVDSPGGAIL